MFIRDKIAAIGRDGQAPIAEGPTPNDILSQWRGAPEVAAVLADVDRLVAGAAVGDCAALMALFAPDGGAARRFAAGLVGVPMLSALAENPLSGLNVAHTATATAAVFSLGGSAPARLMLSVTEGPLCAGLRPGRSAMFQPTLVDEVVLAGVAGATLVSIAGGADAGAVAGAGTMALAHRRIELSPGTVLSYDGRREDCLLDRFEGQLVTLRLCRTIPAAGPAREIDLDSGRIVHTAAADVEDSRRELMVALLGRMGRRAAAPVLARLAQRQGSPTLRWQALRECLGLDTAAGFTALTAVARDSADPLAAHAGALRAQLLEAHPALETIACPA